MGLSTAPPPRSTAADKRRRMIFGGGVVLAYFGLQIITQILAGHARGPIAAQLALWVLQMALIALALNWNYATMTRRRAGPFRNVASSALIAGGIGIVCSYVYSVMMVRWPELRIRPGPPQATPLVRALTFGSMTGLLHGGFWAMAFVFPFAAEDARIRALEADRLRGAAELAHLRAHLEPHFMLNTLNAIAGLVTEDPKQARRLIATLGDLLREAVRQDDEERYTIDDEISWMKRYAELLEARHEGSLSFAWEIDEKARYAMIPRMLLQPLVENAIKHGALKRRGDGKVVVSVTRTTDAGGDARLRCIVADNGPGIGQPRPDSKGLNVVRTQLNLRDPSGTLLVESTQDGARSVVELPLLIADRAEAAQ